MLTSISIEYLKLFKFTSEIYSKHKTLLYYYTDITIFYDLRIIILILNSGCTFPFPSIGILIFLKQKWYCYNNLGQELS